MSTSCTSSSEGLKKRGGDPQIVITVRTKCEDWRPLGRLSTAVGGGRRRILCKIGQRSSRVLGRFRTGQIVQSKDRLVWSVWKSGIERRDGIYGLLGQGRVTP